MKKLLLIRHGKAELPEGDDMARALDQRGILQIKSIASQLLSDDTIPEKMYTSPALRAKQTSEILLNVWEQFRHFPSLQDAPILYGATLEELLKVIQGIPETYTYVALVGHNPSMEQLASYFNGSPLPMGTGNTAGVVFQTIKWKAVSSEAVKSVSIYKP